MKKSHKTGFAFLIFIALIFLLLLVFNLVVQNKIESFVAEDLRDVLSYEELDVKVFRRRISLKSPEITLKNGSVTADEILLNGINYYKYLTADKLILDRVMIDDPHFVWEQSSDTVNKDEATKVTFKQDLLVKTFDINNARVRKLEDTSSKEQWYMSLSNIQIEMFRIDSTSLTRKVPFNYKSYSFEGDSLKMVLDGEHDLYVGAFSAKNRELNFSEVRVDPKFDKVEFQENIPHEKDRFVVQVQNVNLKDFDYGFRNDSLELISAEVNVNRADLQIYRNKLKPDDPRTKSLYSQKIRNLPVKINFQRIKVDSSRIVYEEKLKAGRPPGVVSFTQVNAGIENLTNMRLDRENFPKTTVVADALFMDATPVDLDWKFDVSSKEDFFTISGNLGSVSNESINSFVRPAMNVEVRGGIESLVFTYSGNDDKAVGDVRLKYEDFKVNVLKDDGTEKSSFWSALANLFINNDAVNEDVTHENLEVARNKKKSFWNYVWLCIRKGALSSFL